MSLLTKLRYSLGFFLAGVLFFFLIKPFVQTHFQLKDVSFRIQWHWLLPSFGLLLLYRCLYAYPLTILLCGLTQTHVSFRSTFTLFHLANITRYLPGRIWGVMRLLSLSHRFGLSKIATTSCLTLHVGIETALGGILAVSLVFSTQIRTTATGVLENVSGDILLLTLAFLSGLAGVLFCIPKVKRHVWQFLKTFTLLLGDSRLWINVITSHSLLWICQGLAFFLFVRSLVSVQWTDAGVLTASFAFAWVVGFLSFLTPGGLGVREGLLGILLANYMPSSEATLIALLCRVWVLSAEVILAGIAFFLQKFTYSLDPEKTL